MSHHQRIALATALAVITAAPMAGHTESITTNRSWDELPAPQGDGGRGTLAAAADSLSPVDLQVAGEALTAKRLTSLAETPSGASLTRRLRETLGQAIDRLDFLRFLDDVAREQPERVRVHSGRARRAGILLHPDDVFGNKPRRYGDGAIAIHPPPQPPDLEPAADGAPLGPRWSARYPNPTDEPERMAALSEAGHEDFRRRLDALFDQLRAQGASVHVMSTLRRRERGYLMYGAFILSRASGVDAVEQRSRQLDRLNQAWDLNIPIQWRHPRGWRATVRAAADMAEAYNVVYATRAGARNSSHYHGTAIDFAATRLPRELTLKAPDGQQRRFHLAAPSEPRDINLTPRLIRWIEQHFGLRKLRHDYPHWDDAADR
jgi:hypothetical protein